MQKQRVFLTGATGAMGYLGLTELLKDLDIQDVVTLVRPSEKNKKLLAPFQNTEGLTIHWGDLTNDSDVLACVRDADLVLHVGAIVSPAADYNPKETMRINYGSTLHILNAIKQLGQENKTGLVFIGTVAQTGDRMPPIHWGRVGDPIKPSVFDYYAVSKVAAERLVIESGLKRWVSLRQTGIIGPKMCSIEDAIMFHNCLNNVLEYASDRDSAALLKNLCRKEFEGKLKENFWQHIFNIGGGEGCRTGTYDMFKKMFEAIGIKDLSAVIDTKWFATRNFHGQYYLDSDKLEEILEFRNDSMAYFYDEYLKMLGIMAPIARVMTKLPGGQKLIGSVMKKRFLRLARAEHGTVGFVENKKAGHIAAYWGSQKACDAVSPISAFQCFSDWDTVVPIDHGYDETKPESALCIEDMKGAAAFRGGECVSQSMQTGDWAGQLAFCCAFGHTFNASPRLILEGGHWCPVCERESWNYYARAKVDPFFAQVWTPLHDADEEPYEYKKEVSELDVTDMGKISGSIGG